MPIQKYNKRASKKHANIFMAVKVTMRYAKKSSFWYSFASGEFENKPYIIRNCMQHSVEIIFKVTKIWP